MIRARPPRPPTRLPRRLLDEGWWLTPERGPATIIPFPLQPNAPPGGGTVVLFPAHLLPKRETSRS